MEVFGQKRRADNTSLVTQACPDDRRRGNYARVLKLCPESWREPSPSFGNLAADNNSIGVEDVRGFRHNESYPLWYNRYVTYA